MVMTKEMAIVLGSVVFAGVLYMILAAPGFLSDSAATVSSRHQAAVVRR